MERYEKNEYRLPWRLAQNQIRASGGREMDRFRGITPPTDRPNGAEAWVGSVTRANGATPENPNLGCAEVLLPDGRRRYLFEAIAAEPELALGPAHLARYGTDLGMLVKLLDAKTPFLLQCHPTRENADRFWNSNYGKEECWYIIGVRDDAPEPPYILLGFREGVSREGFEQAYRAGDIAALEAMCHKIEVRPGECYFIPGGVPHALGAGCFVAEIQEPSDLTAVPIAQQALLEFRRRANPKGVFVPEDEALYERRMLNSFHYAGAPLAGTLARCKSAMPLLREEPGGREQEIFGAAQTQCFSCTLVQVHGTFRKTDTHDAQICLILDGSGELVCGGERMLVRRADEIFFPCAATDVRMEGTFSCILCNPGLSAQYRPHAEETEEERTRL